MQRRLSLSVEDVARFVAVPHFAVYVISGDSLSAGRARLVGRCLAEVSHLALVIDHGVSVARAVWRLVATPVGVSANRAVFANAPHDLRIDRLKAHSINNSVRLSRRHGRTVAPSAEP